MSHIALDRKHAPALHWDAKVDIPLIMRHTLDGNEELMLLQEGETPVMFGAISLDAGDSWLDEPLLARGVMETMALGTKQRSEQQIFARLDALGSSIQCSAYPDQPLIMIRCTAEAAEETITLLREILHEPAYDPHIVNRWLTRSRTKFELSLQKASTLANRGFREMVAQQVRLNGQLYPEHFTAFSHERMLAYHRQHISSHGASFLFAGMEKDARIAGLANLMATDHFGENLSFPSVKSIPEEAVQGGIKLVESPIKEQSSICMGYALPALPELDDHDLRIAVTALGGYFGSRLIQNIREEKGYTYGIYSQLRPYLNHTTLSISAEVGNEYMAATLREIDHELRKLQREPVGHEELKRIKAYMIGGFLRSFDGLKNKVSIHLLPLKFRKLPNDFYQRRLESIQSITPERILELAKLYFTPERFHTCVAGPQEVLDGLKWPL